MCSPSVSFLFSVFFVSVVSTKLAHLLTYASTVPPLAFLVFLPTFFLPDFAAVCLARLLLRPIRTWLSLITAILGTVLTLITLSAASSELGFFFKTGGELEWHEAKTFASDKDGIKLLLTGIWGVLACGALVIGVAWFAQNFLYRVVGDFLTSIYDLFLSVLRCCLRRRREQRNAKGISGQNDNASLHSDDADSYTKHDGSESHMLIGDGEKPFNEEPQRRSRCNIIPSWLLKTATLAFLTLTSLLRPDKPYDHMSTTLPVHFLDIFKNEPDHCAEQRRIMKNKWPFPQLLDNSNWEEAHGDFKGWAPGTDSPLVNQYRQRRPDWLPDVLPRGFLRWDPKRFDPSVDDSHGDVVDTWKDRCPGLRLKDPFYNPVNDPLKITNLDADVFEPLKGALGDGSVKIKNVVFVLMESLRQELFPLRQGSEIHQTIINSNDESEKARVNALLSKLTPHIEKITEVSGDFKDADGNGYEAAELKWKDQAKPGFGGINVRGSFTMATMSTKSFGSNHCGAWPMPVEKFDEADTDSYQPCIPQILDLLNQGKDNSTDSEDYKDWPWYPALFEAETEIYDRQELFDQKIGFKHIVCRKQLEEDWRYNKSDPIYKPVNYFGFAEPVLKPYIKDYVTNATANKQRIWMSHFTSTTHHAWDTPDSFTTEDYLPNTGVNGWHKDFNKYINTIRFHDQWMAELMQLFDDLGISNETLIVFAGDHGQTFKEDYHKTGTYEIGHVSDFRVPIVFRHPHLPRIQHEVNASTISILPTILDLLINSGSLNEDDKYITSDLIQDYEGQSLIRPYKTSHNGRRAWNFAVINSGAGMLAVTSADVQWRLVMPLNKVFEYTFTDTQNDSEERDPTTAWTVEKLTEAVEIKHGEGAARWATEAVEVAKWWSLERQRLWRYRLLSKHKPPKPPGKPPHDDKKHEHKDHKHDDPHH